LIGATTERVRRVAQGAHMLQLLLPAVAQVDLATLSLPLQHGFHPPPAGRPSSDS